METSFVIFDFRSTAIACKNVSNFFFYTTVQDAPGEAENVTNGSCVSGEILATFLERGFLT